jgi:dipeptidyl-peptidase-4
MKISAMPNQLLYKVFFCLALFLSSLAASSQLYEKMNWSADGNSFFVTNEGNIVQINIAGKKQEILVTPQLLVPAGEKQPLEIKSFSSSTDRKKILIYTNAKKVWRYETRGDYWIYNLSDSSLRKLGKTLPPSSLMFAKFSPDDSKVAYVSGDNIYLEDISTHVIKALTTNGSRKMINGTFDWVYEEELNCRDGFRWSPDSRSIAFWQINDSSTRDYDMINTTDSLYSHIIPVEYPVAGQMPSPFRIGIIQLSDKQTTWMKISTDKKNGTYLPRMEWTPDSRELVVQRLNRSQNESDIMLCNAKTGEPHIIYNEKSSAWIDVISEWNAKYQMGGWDWLNNGSEFLWASEKNGWRQLYRIARDGKETLITKGNYDVIEISLVDEKNNTLYFMASPDNATQSYLYRCALDGSGKAERISPLNQNGTHSYEISPNGRLAFHQFSNYYTEPGGEWISLPDHQALAGTRPLKPVNRTDSAASNVSFFTVQTKDGVTMDGWMQKPIPFDSTKKYPVLFYVYTEPGDATVKDVYGVTTHTVMNFDWLAPEGYIYISIDNRGTPAPKGTAWRQAIYRKIGQINIQDQAAAATEICKWPFVDTSRIAVWGWSGGGSATLGLMFLHPEIYKTGVAISALGNLQTYDNIYQERYMGNPAETRADYVKGSAITYASGLQGNLLYIHGSGDDNVHYDNAEMLLNELIKYNKIFQFMEYPNRTHSIIEGDGTREHLMNLFKNYLNTHCPGGSK